MSGHHALRLHISLQYYRCTDLVYKRLVLPCLFLQSAVYYCPVCHDGGETLVIILYGNVRTDLAPSVYKLLNTGEIFARAPVCLHRLAHNDKLYRLTADISLYIIEQLMRRNSRQSSGYNLQRIGDCQACTFLPVIY